MHIRLSLPGLITAAFAVGLVLTAPVLARAGFEDGAAAYQQGDYAKALREWTPLAEQGNQRAQYNIGYMLFNGIGVAKEPDKAARWFGMAAAQGDAAAQMSLGVMYGTGQGVPQDYTQAYIWLTLAAARLPYGDDRDQAIKNRDIVSSKMTRPQITEALGQALNWTPARDGAAATQTATAGMPLVTPAASAPAPATGASNSPGAAPGAQIADANGSGVAASKPDSDADAEAAAQAKAAEAEAAAEAATRVAQAKAAARAQAAAKAAAAARAEAAAEAKAAARAKAAEDAKQAADAQAAQAADAPPAPAAPVAPPAPADPAAPAAADTQTAALTAGTGYLVQLAALRSMDAARTEWARLKQRYGALLGGMEPVLQPVDLGAKGTFVRVHVGPFADPAEAGEVCRALRSQAQDCVVVPSKGRV